MTSKNTKLYPVRRVVTTNNANGRSEILSDTISPHTVDTGVARGLTDLWTTPSQGPDLTVVDGASAQIRLEPPMGGSVFRFFQLAPANATTETSETTESDAFARMGASHLRVDTSTHHAMHRTHTIDYIILLKGRVELVLEEERTILEPFDTVVQKGTNHAWVNLSPEPALLVAVLLDASLKRNSEFSFA